jgi:glycerol-3-phosphate O-acyltransferase
MRLEVEVLVLDPVRVVELQRQPQQALAYGRQAYLQRRISSEASIGKLYFSNGFKLAENLGLGGEGDEAVQERRRELAQGFRALQRRLERVRAVALPL